MAVTPDQFRAAFAEYQQARTIFDSHTEDIAEMAANLLITTGAPNLRAVYADDFAMTDAIRKLDPEFIDATLAELPTPQDQPGEA